MNLVFLHSDNFSDPTDYLSKSFLTYFLALHSGVYILEMIMLGYDGVWQNVSSAHVMGIFPFLKHFPGPLQSP